MEKLLVGQGGPAGVSRALLHCRLTHPVAIPSALGFVVLDLGKLRSDEAPSTFCSRWAFTTNRCVLCVPPCLPPEPKDEVEVSDDGECWPPVLRYTRGAEGGERGI